MSTPATELPGGENASGSIFDLDNELFNSHGLDPDLSSDPPLGTDERAGDAGAGAPKADAGTEGAGVAAGKAGVKGDAAGGDKGKVDGDDLELDEEDRVAKSLSDEDKPIYERTRKAANFEKHFRAGTASVDYLKQQSEGRYGEFAAKVIRDRASDAKRFVADDLDDATYGAVYAELVRSNPTWIVEKLTGRKDLSLVQLKELVDGNGASESSQLKSAFESMPKLDELKDSDGNVYELEDLALDCPALADWIKAVQLAGTDQLPKAFTSKLEAANAEVARLKAELEGKAAKTDAQTPKAGENENEPGTQVQLTAEAIASRQAVDKVNYDYVERYALDKDGLNLAVTDAEREAAPEVADIKDTFLENWIAGSPKKSIPNFADGLIAHFKGNEKFRTVARQVKYYADRGETENATDEAAKLTRFIDAYRKVRVELPYFKSLRRLVDMHSKAASKGPRLERVIPGGGSQASSPGSGVEETDEDLLNSFGMD